MERVTGEAMERLYKRALALCETADVQLNDHPITRDDIITIVTDGVRHLQQTVDLTHRIACFEFYRLPDDGYGIAFRMVLQELLKP